MHCSRVSPCWVSGVYAVQSHTCCTLMDIHVDMCLCTHTAWMHTNTHIPNEAALLMMFVLRPPHVCSLLCDRRRRLNNNDLSVLEATGAFKGLSQLKKM